MDLRRRTGQECSGVQAVCEGRDAVICRDQFFGMRRGEFRTESGPRTVQDSVEQRRGEIRRRGQAEAADISGEAYQEGRRELLYEIHVAEVELCISCQGMSKEGERRTLR